MDNKFSVGDLVLYENKVYLVKAVHLLNPQIPSDPYVCGLALYDDTRPYPTQLMVREGLLTKPSPTALSKALKVLYGDKGSSN